MYVHLTTYFAEMLNRHPLLYLTFILLTSCGLSEATRDRALKIGKSIITNVDSTNAKRPVIADVVVIGDGLIEKILLIKRTARHYNFAVENGDLPTPYGNHKADCILIIDTDFQDVGIRLKYNRQKDKYDILGWMTLINWSKAGD